MKIREFKIFIKTIRLQRLWNAAMVFVSYYLSNFIKRPIHWGLPIAIAVEPTTACNLRCPQCPSGLRSFNRPTGNLKIQEFQKWLEPIKNKVWAVTFYFQGEPFIHPDVEEGISIAHKFGLYTMSSTNGHFLDKQRAERIIQSGLDRLIISLDGTTQEIYEIYRKEGKLDKVIAGIQNLVAMKRQLKSATPYVIIQFIVMKSNEHQISDLKKLADSLGVDELKLKTAQIYDFENDSDFIPESQVYSRYQKNETGQFQIKNELKNRCWKLWHAPVITWDGQVVPCCFDKDASHPLGSLKDDNFKAIWNGNEYMNFRKQIWSSRKAVAICKNCTEGTRVWI